MIFVYESLEGVSMIEFIGFFGGLRIGFNRFFFDKVEVGRGRREERLRFYI